MKVIKEQFIVWKDNINHGNYEEIIQKFQNQIIHNKWSLKEEIFLATSCLVAINLKAEEASKKNSVNKEHLSNIFHLSKICCKCIAKDWQYVTIDFPSAVFYICKNFIVTEFIKEALEITQYIFEFQEARHITPLKNKPDVLYLLISMFLNTAEKLELSSRNITTINEIWNFVISKIGSVLKNSNIYKFFRFFVSFVLKSSKSMIDSYTDMCSSFIKQIICQICKFEENPELTFLKIYRQMVYELCALSVSKKKDQLLLECFETFCCFYKDTSVAVNICRSIVCIAIRVPSDSCSMSDLVKKCNQELKSFLLLQSITTISEVIYISCAVMIKLNNWSQNEVIFRDCINELLELLLTLAKKMYEIDLNELIWEKKNDEIKRDIFSVVHMFNFVLYFTYATVDINLNNAVIYSYVLETQTACSQFICECHQLEKAKRLHLYFTLGAGFVNICRAYMKNELYDKCLELSLIATKGFASVPPDELSDSNIQICVYKLVICLCNSYRNKCMYIEALRTACVWMIILPGCKTSFMDIYGSIKAKLYTLKIEEKYLKMTSADLVTKKEYEKWKNENLNYANVVSLLLHLELKQYLKHNICSLILIQKILKIIEKEEKSLTKKVECYITAAKILTNTNNENCLNYVKNLLKNINSFIDVFGQALEVTNEKQNVLLGDLYFVKFRIKLLIMRCENESEIKILNSMKKPSIAEPGMEEDPKESCDILPVNYKYLTSQTKLTNLLDLAVRHWHNGILNKCSNLDLSHLKDVGFVYRLYCDEVNEIKTWELLYIAAVHLNVIEDVVFAYSNLLNTTWSVNEEWKQNVEKDMLTKVNESTLLYYQLNYLSRCLVDGFDQNSVEMLKNISVDQAKKCDLLVHYHQLMAQCQFRNIVSFTRNPITMSFYAYSLIIQTIKNEKWKNFAHCCELQSLFFEIVVFVISITADIYQIMDAKSYLRNSIDLVQKLSIPLRTCQILHSSIRLDILTCSLQDSYLKLQNSLGILDAEQLVPSSKLHSFKSSVPVATQLPALKSDFRSANDINFVDFNTSPVLINRLQFQLPDFIKHNLNCDCVMCLNNEYVYLYCELLFLLAIYHRLCNKLNDANDYLTGVFKMCEIVENRFRSRDHRIPIQFLALKIYITAELSNYWFAKGDLEKSETYISEALSYPLTGNLPIYAECMEQSCAIDAARFLMIEQQKEVRHSEKANILRKKLPIPSTVLKTPSGKFAEGAKLLKDTEENKDNFVKDLTPYPRRSRRALFDDLVTPAKPPVKSRTGITKKKTQMNTPPDIVLQTPSVIEKRTKKTTTLLVHNQKKITRNVSKNTSKSNQDEVRQCKKLNRL